MLSHIDTPEIGSTAAGDTHERVERDAVVAELLAAFDECIWSTGPPETVDEMRRHHGVVDADILDRYGLGPLTLKQMEVMADAGVTLAEAEDATARPTRTFTVEETIAMINQDLRTEFPDLKLLRASTENFPVVHLQWLGSPSLAGMQRVLYRYEMVEYDLFRNRYEDTGATIARTDGCWHRAIFPEGLSFVLERQVDMGEVNRIQSESKEPDGVFDETVNGFRHCGTCGNRLTHNNPVWTVGDVHMCSNSCWAARAEMTQ